MRKLVSLCALPLVLLTGTVVNTTPTPPPMPTVTATPLPQSLSPYRIMARLDESGMTAAEEIWPELGLGEAPFGLTYSLYGEEEITPEVLKEVIRFKYLRLENWDSGEYIALIVWERESWNNYCLIFRSRNRGAWEFLGQVWFRQKYCCDKQWFIGGGSTVWLVIRFLVGAGTGLSTSIDEWYRLDRGKSELVLSYPSAGYISGEMVSLLSRPSAGRTPCCMITPDLSCEVEVKALECCTDCTIELAYKLSYSSYHLGYDTDLFSAERRTYYAWVPEEGRFRFDAARSQIPQSKVEKGFFDWDSKFLSLFHEELTQLAEDGNYSQKDWLWQFLNDCGEELEDRSEREKLLKILETTRKRQDYNAPGR